MISDRQLQANVEAALSREPSVDAAHVGVTASAGVVTLTGHVASFAQKDGAEATAAKVAGVKAVIQSLDLQLPFEGRRGDDEIAATAVARLHSDTMVPRDVLKISVESGLITLRGEVDWHYQKDAAEQNLRRIPGVLAVLNEVTIKPTLDTENVRDDIVHALHRSWFFDPDAVLVSADRGVVRLSGTVRSPHERQVAASTAWASPGVTDVKNDLVVG